MTKIVFLKSDPSWGYIDFSVPQFGLNSEELKDYKSGTEPILRCKIAIAKEVYVYAYAYKAIVIISSVPNLNFWQRQEIIDVESFVQIEVIGNAFEKYNEYKDYRGKSRQELDRYGDSNYIFKNKDGSGNFAFLHLKLKATLTNELSIEGELKFRWPNFGQVMFNELNSNSRSRIIEVYTNFFGKELYRECSLNDSDSKSYLKDDFYCYGLRSIKTLATQNFEISNENLNKLIDLYLSQFDFFDLLPEDGIKGIKKQKKINTILDKLYKEDPLIWRFFLYCHNNKVRDGSSNNMLLATFLKTYQDNYDEIKNQLKNVMLKFFTSQDNLKICLLTLGGAKEKEQEKRAQKEWYLRKNLGEQANGLGITEKLYPKLFKAVCEENIPIGVFHQPGKHHDLVNVEFDLWEKSLNRKDWDQIIFDIAQNASRRNTYARYITPYLSFLFRLEDYLNKHSQPYNNLIKRKWQAFPSFVQSTQLDLSDEDKTENGTVKKRSALTPIVDNKKNTITVPYAAIAMHGRQTTYCYSSHYYVFEENTIDPESQSVVTKDLEIGLNGRDDYGLMYYTLDGTARNQGYPTFLIILERRKCNTYVHFHRVHPSRIKDGVKIPACRLIEECYRYMAGNVRAEEILYQQGDLLFLKAEDPKDYDPNELKGILEFESHRFKSYDQGVIRLLPNKNKSIKNRLGFIYCENKFNVEHPEHESTPDMDPGWYEVRRCKSWEANPMTVWSYTID